MVEKNNIDEMAKSITMYTMPNAISWVCNHFPSDYKTIGIKDCWKNGKEYPTLKELEDICKKIKKPKAFFFMNPHEKHTKPLLEIDSRIENRTINNATIQYSYKFSIALQEILYNRIYYIELCDKTQINYNPKYQKFTLYDGMDIEEIIFELSNYIRNLVVPPANLLNQEQRIYTKYSTPSKFKQYITEKIESLNILIVKLDKKIENDLRGFAICGEILPIIGIANTGEADVGQIFTIIHELCHILINSTMVHCSQTTELSHQKIEQICNKITQNVLLPKEFITYRAELKNIKTLQDVTNICYEYCMSREAFVIALFDNKVMTRTIKERLLQEIKDTPFHKKGGGGKETHLYTTINKYGVPFCKAVKKAYTQGYIKQVDLYTIFNRKTKYCMEILRKI